MLRQFAYLFLCILALSFTACKGSKKAGKGKGDNPTTTIPNTEQNTEENANALGLNCFYDTIQGKAHILSIQPFPDQKETAPYRTQQITYKFYPNDAGFSHPTIHFRDKYIHYLQKNGVNILPGVAYLKRYQLSAGRTIPMNMLIIKRGDDDCQHLVPNAKMMPLGDLTTITAETGYILPNQMIVDEEYVSSGGEKGNSNNVGIMGGTIESQDPNANMDAIMDVRPVPSLLETKGCSVIEARGFIEIIEIRDIENFHAYNALEVVFRFTPIDEVPKSIIDRYNRELFFLNIDGKNYPPGPMYLKRYLIHLNTRHQAILQYSNTQRCRGMKEIRIKSMPNDVFELR